MVATPDRAEPSAHSLWPARGTLMTATRASGLAPPSTWRIADYLSAGNWEGARPRAPLLRPPGPVLQFRASRGLAGTIRGGSTFLGIQAYEWTHLIHEGLTIQGNPFGISTLFGATFFVLTGFHGCHVLSGVIYLGCIMIKGARDGYSPQRHSPVELAGP